MKRWLVFLIVFAASLWVLATAVRKNLEFLRQETEPVVQPVTQAEESPMIPPAMTTAESSLRALTEAEVTSVSLESKGAPEKGEVKQDFVRKMFSLLELYREANQSFLQKDLKKAETIFRSAFDESFALSAGSPVEETIKKHLFQALRARLESIRFYGKMQNSSDEETIETLWAQNIEELKKANQSVTEVIRLTGRLIQTELADAAGGKDPALLQDLQENAKGILVVSKSAHS